jgi:hypothetical protein
MNARPAFTRLTQRIVRPDWAAVVEVAVDLRVPAWGAFALLGDALEEDLAVVALGAALVAETGLTALPRLAAGVADVLDAALPVAFALGSAFTAWGGAAAAFAARGFGAPASGADLAALLEGVLVVFLVDSLIGVPSSSQFPQVQT